MANKVNFKDGHVNGFFYEYAFCRAVNEVNRELPEGQKLKKSQVMVLRNTVEESLRKDPYWATNERQLSSRVSVLVQNLSPVLFQQHMATCLEQAIGRKDLESVQRLKPEAEGDYKKVSRGLYEMLTDFAAMTGAELKFGPNKGIVKSERLMLPLSPYMPGMTDREVALKNGLRMLYVTDEAATQVTYDYSDLGNIDEGIDLFLSANPDDSVPTKFRKAGPAMSPDDRSGLSALRPFMSEKELQDLSADNWTQNGGIVRGPDGKTERRFMDPASISRVREVVRSLRESGTDFTFQRDRRRGQVKIHFDTGMDVRVIDPYNPTYAGARCYDDGVSVYYQADGVRQENGSRQRFTEYVPQTPQECLDLIHFALGDKVERWDKPGMQVGAPEVGANGMKNLSFHASKNFRAKIGTRTVNGQQVPISIFHNVSRSPSAMMFHERDDAEDYLRTAISSARSNLSEQVALERILEVAAERQAMFDKAEELGDEDMSAEAEGMLPAFSYNPDVKAIQEKYWEVLTVPGTTLFRPDVNVEDSGEDVEAALSGEELTAAMYEGTPEEICRQHLADALDCFIGQYEADESGLRFDPVNTAKFMTSSYGVFRNNDDLTSAMRRVDVKPEELRGNDYYTNVFRGKLIRYDEASAQPLKGYVARGADGQPIESGFMDRMFNVIKTSIQSNGCYVDDDAIMVDKNGIVRYTARRVESEGTKAAGKQESRRPVEVTGEIGQLFAPDRHGVVNAGDHLFVPGYLARIEPNKAGQNLPYEDRMVLEGYEQVLTKTIQDTLRRDLMVTEKEVGVPYSLNTAVRRLYDTRYPLDFYQRTAEAGMTDELRQAIIDTNKSRVRLDKKLMSDSGRLALYQARRHAGFDPLDDYKMDAVTLTDGRNPAVMEEPGDGRFDPFFTGNGGAQGVRYLVRGTEVTPEGRIIPSKDLGARCAMVEYLQQSGRYPDFDAVDRMNMTGNGLLHGLRETEPVGMAQVSLGCMTFEDGIVVSKAFAETHQVARQSDGTMRPLTIGDKMECHGNKGVIGAIIDPEMSDQEASDRGLWDARDLFRANPELQVVMSPYSSVSRFNAGMGAEAINSDPTALTMPDGTVHEGSIGYVKMTILEQTADKKTHFSDDGTQKRAYGAQLVWALASNDCTELLKDSFQDNYKSLANLRELLLTCGMDIDPTGRLQIGYHKQPGEERRMFEMGPLQWKEFERAGKPGRRLDVTGMRRQFGEQVSMMGGFMEVPFEIKLPTGEMLPQIPDEERSEASKAAYPGPTYRMPIMSAYLRSGQELDDGESVVHDYTNSYLSIYEAALRFQEAAETKARLTGQGATAEDADKDLLEKAEKTLRDMPGVAQAEYSKITDDVKARRFQGKRNFFRTNLMSNKQSRSATAIWSPDPNMEPDSVGMNPEMAIVLGLATRGEDGKVELNEPENSYALVHRDPVIMPSGIRYMKVKLQEDATGITINPMCVGGFQGDFDGDTVGVHVPHGGKAKAEAMAKLSVRANLLDKSAYDPETDRYKLFIAGGQDIAAAWAVDPQLKKDYEALEAGVNQFEADYKKGAITLADVNQKRDQAIMDIGGYLYDCAQASFGRHVISYASPEEHIKSIERFVDDRAKGSLGKVQDYAKFLGLEYQTTDDGHLVDGTGKQASSTLASRDANIGILKAKNMQQQYTGAAGQFSIRAVKTLFNVEPAAATTLNALATQGVLQVKHSPAQADRFEQILSGPARDVWKGYALEETQDVVTDLKPVMDPKTRQTRMEGESTMVDTWRPILDDERKPVPATRDQFVQQFMDVYGSKRGMGLDVNVRMVEQIAKVCSKDGMMENIEEGLCEKYAAPMQQLAYGGDFDTLVELAKRQEADPSYPGLFEAMPDSPHDYNFCLADGTVMRPNLQLKRDHAAGRRLDEDFKPICRQDTQVSGKKKEPNHVTTLGASAKTAKAPVVRDGSDIKAPSTAPGDGKNSDGVSL